MNKQTLNRMMIVIALCGAGFFSLANAGMDEAQRQLIQRVTQAKQVQQQAQAAKGAERQKLLDNHMKLMHENMDTCRSMKPKAGMTEKERDEWFAEHQNIMNQMMDQMMTDYHMVTELNGGSAESGTHKH